MLSIGGKSVVVSISCMKRPKEHPVGDWSALLRFSTQKGYIAPSVTSVVGDSMQTPVASLALIPQPPQPRNPQGGCTICLHFTNPCLGDAPVNTFMYNY